MNEITIETAVKNNWDEIIANIDAYPTFMDNRQFAQLMQVDVRTVSSWLKLEQIDGAKKIGGTWRISKAVFLNAWKNSCVKKARIDADVYPEPSAEELKEWGGTKLHIPAAVPTCAPADEWE